MTDDIPPFLKIAHRGYSSKYPENTLPAFAGAIEAGADMIELDVHLSQDGQIVVIHDERIDRTASGSGKVAEMSLAELRRFSYHNSMAEFGFVEIPTLEETIALVEGRAVLNIEIKKRPGRYGGIEETLSALLREWGARERCIVSSFDIEALHDIKRMAPDIRTALIYDRVWFPFRETVQSLRLYSVHPSVKAMNVKQLRWVKSCGLMVYPWVAKNRAVVEKCRAADFIDGVMVNDLELFQ
jgi:glycerophosphoryl diester phosphodiesterase